MNNVKYPCQWLIYTGLGVVADIWNFMVYLVVPDTRHKEWMQSDIDTLTDEELLTLVKDAPQLTSLPNPVLLSPGTVAKCVNSFNISDHPDSPEANAQQLAFLRTTNPVPRIHRVLKFSNYMQVIVMDYIKGPTLAEAWPTYSLWQKIRVAITLRRYIRQLRRATASHTTTPGPISSQGPKRCDVPSIFGLVRSTRGPFASYKDLSDFMNRRYTAYFRFHPEKTEGIDERFDDSSPLVLTHNDLNPRNIIVGEDGRLWIVDWAWAGFYPPWFEFCAMSEQVENERRGGWSDRFWELMVPFVCGPSFKQQRWLDRAGVGLDCR